MLKVWVMREHWQRTKNRAVGWINGTLAGRDPKARVWFRQLGADGLHVLKSVPAGELRELTELEKELYQVNK